MKSNKWLTLILVVAVLYLIALGISLFFTEGNSSESIAIIPIQGTIAYGQTSYFGGNAGADPNSIIGFIEEANKNPSVKGIVLEINSGGGTVLASKEIATAVKNSEKPVVAVIKEVGASGAYWVASASDYIIADELSITGSIGVLGSYLEFSELFDKYGVDYERLVGGQYKDVGSPFKDLSEEERKILQKKIDLIHDAFIQEVAKNRNMDVEKVREAANGMFYLGSEAKELGLIDGYGNMQTGIEKVQSLTNMTGEAHTIRYERQASLLDYFSVYSNQQAHAIGQGIAEGLTNVEQDYQIKAE